MTSNGSQPVSEELKNQWLKITGHAIEECHTFPDQSGHS